MGKNAKKSKKTKAMKVDQAQQRLAQESVSAVTTTEPKSDDLQELAKPTEEEMAAVVVAAVSAEESKKIDEAIKTAETKKTGKTKSAKKSAAKTVAEKERTRKVLTDVSDNGGFAELICIHVNFTFRKPVKSLGRWDEFIMRLLGTVETVNDIVCKFFNRHLYQQ